MVPGTDMALWATQLSEPGDYNFSYHRVGSLKTRMRNIELMVCPICWCWHPDENISVHPGLNASEYLLLPIGPGRTNAFYFSYQFENKVSKCYWTVCLSAWYQQSQTLNTEICSGGVRVVLLLVLCKENRKAIAQKPKLCDGFKRAPFKGKIHEEGVQCHGLCWLVGSDVKLPWFS